MDDRKKAKSIRDNPTRAAHKRWERTSVRFGIRQEVRENEYTITNTRMLDIPSKASILGKPLKKAADDGEPLHLRQICWIDFESNLSQKSKS